MRRAPVLFLAVALCASIAPAAGAAVRKRPPAPKPLPMTYFFHGDSAYGNQDTAVGSGLTMNATKPTGTTTKEVAMFGGNIGGALLVPKACPGGPYIPAFVGAVSGTLSGVVTVTFYARSTGGNVTVQLVSDPGDCSAGVAPAAQALIPVPQSQTASLVTAKLMLPAKGAKVSSSMSIQFLTDQTTGPAAVGVDGISYDSASTTSSVAFTCLPKTGKKTC